MMSPLSNRFDIRIVIKTRICFIDDNYKKIINKLPTIFDLYTHCEVCLQTVAIPFLPSFLILVAAGFSPRFIDGHQ